MKLAEVSRAILCIAIVVLSSCSESEDSATDQWIGTWEIVGVSSENLFLSTVPGIASYTFHEDGSFEQSVASDFLADGKGFTETGQFILTDDRFVLVVTTSEDSEQKRVEGTWLISEDQLILHIEDERDVLLKKTEDSSGSLSYRQSRTSSQFP